MSHLKKSTSFRSRIPVRRHSPQHIRCFNNTKATTDNLGKVNKNQAYKVGRCYSSSFSSADESCESEIAVNKTCISKSLKYLDFDQSNLMYRSADTISLDGQLDSISTCGSFSSPPSPVNQSKYMIKFFLNALCAK